MIEIKTDKSLSSVADLISAKVLNGIPFESLDDWGVPTFQSPSVFGMKISLASQGDNFPFLLHLEFDFLPDENATLTGFREKIQIYFADLLAINGIPVTLRIRTAEEAKEAMTKPKIGKDGKPIIPGRVIGKGLS